MHAIEGMSKIAPLTWSNGHIRFDPVVRNSRRAWEIRLVKSGASGEPVAYIRWHGLWREYVLRTQAGYIFAHDCLSDISVLIRHLNQSHAWPLPAS